MVADFAQTGGGVKNTHRGLDGAGQILHYLITARGQSSTGPPETKIMTFQVDTSGTVICAASVFPTGYHPMIVKWSDLSPFTQGYVEALLTEFNRAILNPPSLHPIRPNAFRDLAPETLARIIADCEEYQRIHSDLIGSSRHPEGLPRLGRLFWIDRQNATVGPFPPLTVQLGDDGKVSFA